MIARTIFFREHAIAVLSGCTIVRMADRITLRKKEKQCPTPTNTNMDYFYSIVYQYVVSTKYSVLIITSKELSTAKRC